GSAAATWPAGITAVHSSSVTMIAMPSGSARCVARAIGHVQQLLIWPASMSASVTSTVIAIVFGSPTAHLLARERAARGLPHVDGTAEARRVETRIAVSDEPVEHRP